MRGPTPDEMPDEFRTVEPRLQKFVHRNLLSNLPEPVGPEVIVREALCRGVAAFTSFRPEGRDPLFRWLGRIALRVIGDLRHRRRPPAK